MIIKRKEISWILLIAWMILIAVMSNQPAEISDSQSIGVINFLQRIGINMNLIFGQLSNFIIRKCAHFLEYAILGILLYNVLIMYFQNKKLIILCILLCMFYAITDEIHQLFISGREGALRDVIIDTCGGLFGTIVNNILYKKRLSH